MDTPTASTGSDGRLWFAPSIGDYFGAITTSGTMSAIWFEAGSRPQQIVGGPDGRLWCTTQGFRVAVFTPTTGGIANGTYFPVSGEPWGIAVGPDNNIWYTSSPYIGRIGGAGGQVRLSDPNSRPLGITAGPEGNIWFTDPGTNSIGVVVLSNSGLTLTPSALTFSGTAGGPAAAPQALGVTAETATPFSASVTTSDGGRWLKISPSGDLTTNQTITVTPDPSSVTNPATLTGTIMISSSGAHKPSA